ncbi:TRAP transporter small permease [Allofranklinella schreckenbergeri]|uniref:TRAP transporter small permease protein n=1 Tax=Allofranklinella schreckenbergeri TaxID=1076744 RepID=A0A3M6PWK2_9BURK|nr:TRAP transporter small permease [Allofranklinella schreckenbergeri]
MPSIAPNALTQKGGNTVQHLIYGISRALAWLGAAVLIVLAVLSVVSISGRALSQWGLGPVPGDFELVEAGTAFAVFCFLPWTHLTRSHAVVDLFWGLYPPLMKKLLIVVSDAVMLLLWVLLTWRLAAGMQDYRATQELTFILQFPVWWGYAACLLPGVFGCLVYLWRLLEDVGLARPPLRFTAPQGGH